jgi:4-amino-4-deoxy-L-arabinose transferase-like glycosyltransferase
LLLLLNPVGYVGGGNDDGRYLEAARCLVDYAGWCTPTTHWAARWPVVVPLATAIALLGETRTAVALASAPWAAATILLLMAIVHHWAGSRAALLAGGTLVLTPVYTLMSLAPSSDVPELAFLIGGWLAASRGKPLGAGLLFGLAVATRETAAVSLVILPIAWRVWPPSTRSLVRGAVGLAAPLAAEALVHGVTAGDPLLRLHLALAHTSISSTELTTGTNPGSPLFNLTLVRHWKPATGIHVHWLLDPLLNLLASPWCGIVLAAATGLLAVSGRRAGALPWLLAIGSAAVALVLIFVLAIDPKPRMFLVVIAAATAIIGIDLAKRLAAGERLVPLLLLALIAAKGMATIADQPNLLRAEPIAARWLSHVPRTLVLDANTKSRLALVREARPFRTGTGRPRLTLEAGPCKQGAARGADIRRADDGLIAAIRRTGFLLGPRERNSLCLYR